MHPVEVRVDSRIRIPLSAVDEEVLERLRKDCEHPNPEFGKRIALKMSVWKTPKFLRTWRNENGMLSLPRGAMKHVRKRLREKRIAYRVVDARTEGSMTVLRQPLKYIGHEPRVYQHEAARIALEKEQGIIRAATGTGKTTTALFLASQIGLNTLIIVPNTKLLDQTIRVAGELLGLHGDRIGQLGDGKRRLRPITIATQQTLWSKHGDTEIQEYFGAVIVDEAHHAAARTFAQVIDQFACRYRFAFSADERRNDRLECLVYDAFGDILHETTREHAEEMKAIVDVEVRIVMSDFRADWYRDAEDVDDKDFDKLLIEMTTNDDRNALIVDTAMNEIEEGHQGIVLTHRREHAFLLDTSLIGRGARCGRMLGGKGADANEFEMTNKGLRDRVMNVGVGTYEALGEGIDLPDIQFGIATTHIAKNKQRFNQVRGRLCRPGEDKTHGRLYVIFDRYVFDEHVFANILAWNRTVKIRHRGKWVDARKFKRAIMAA